jgi:DNA-binding protein H-NS
MATYLELKEQAEKLLAQAEELRRRETQEAIADIRQKMQAYGITPQDLGFASAPARRAAARKDSKAPRYRGPNGETYAGGRGPKPKWLKEALAQGKRLEDFEQH